MKIFLLSFDSIFKVLQTGAENRSFEENQRATAQGLSLIFQTKQIFVTTCLFREIFAMTGSLGRYLQSIDVHFGKAIDIVDGSIEKSGKCEIELRKFFK